MNYRAQVRNASGGIVLCVRAVHQTRAAAWVWYKGRKRHVHSQWNIGMVYWYLGGLYQPTRG